MEMDMARAASVMKLVCGVGNNAAWLVMLEAHDTLFDSTTEAVEDFDDVFRTKGEQKKAMREIAEIRREIE